MSSSVEYPNSGTQRGWLSRNNGEQESGEIQHFAHSRKECNNVSFLLMYSSNKTSYLSKGGRKSRDWVLTSLSNVVKNEVPRI